MENNIIEGKDNVIYANETVRVLDTVVNGVNTRSITAFNPIRSHIPGREIDPLPILNEGEGYVLDAIESFYLAQVSPPFPTGSTNGNVIYAEDGTTPFAPE